MFDFKFDWCKEMECGVKAIDDQHQILVRIGRDMEQLIMNGCQNATSKELLNIVCELREYTSYHFYTEEDLMAKYNYPMSDKHKASHVEFRSNILNINLPLLGKHPEQVLPQIKIHLQDFLFNHILIEDQELVRYIKTCANE